LVNEARRSDSDRQAIINAGRAAAEKALEEAAQTRIALAQREQDEQAKLARLEAERATAALTAGAAAARALAAGEAFEAQRIDLEAARQQALRDALAAGHDERLGLIEDYYDARAELIAAREQEQMRRDR